MGNAFDICTRDIDASQNTQNLIVENQKLKRNKEGNRTNQDYAENIEAKQLSEQFDQKQQIETKNHQNEETKENEQRKKILKENLNDKQIIGKKEDNVDQNIEKKQENIFEEKNIGNNDLNLENSENLEKDIQNQQNIEAREIKNKEKQTIDQEVNIMQNQKNIAQNEVQALIFNLLKTQKNINQKSEEKMEKVKVTIGIQTDEPPLLRNKKKKGRKPNFYQKFDIQQNSPLVSTTDQYELPPNRPTEYVPEEIKNLIEKQNKQQSICKRPQKANRPNFLEDQQIFDEQEQVEQQRYSEMIMAYNQNEFSIAPIKLNFNDFINFQERQKYKTIILGDEYYQEEDFKLLHLSSDNNFFNSLGQLKYITNLQIKFASIYGASGLIQKLVEAINQLSSLVILDLDFKPNIDLLNKLIECNEIIRMAKIKKNMIEKQRLLQQELQKQQAVDTNTIEQETDDQEKQLANSIKEEKQNYKTYRSYLLTTNETILLTKVQNLPSLQELILNFSLNLLDEVAIQGLLNYVSDLDQLTVLKLNCLTQFSGIYKDNQQQYLEFLEDSLKNAKIIFS